MVEKNRLGYACINMELNSLPKKKRVTTNSNIWVVPKKNWLNFDK